MIENKYENHLKCQIINQHFVALKFDFKINQKNFQNH